MGRHVEQKSPLWHVKIVPSVQNLDGRRLDTRPLVSLQRHALRTGQQSETGARAARFISERMGQKKKKKIKNCKKAISFWIKISCVISL
jgi:hypothetical protein